MEYVIRECERKDIGKLVELCGKHAAHEKATYGEQNKSSNLAVALFDKPQRLYCLVLEANAVVVGYCSYTFDYSTWDAQTYLHMDCLYIEPMYRGRGIGKAVISLLEQVARRNNCINIQWQTPSFNEDAIDSMHAWVQRQN